MPRAESYLEIREENSERYWHLVQEGVRHILRFGSLIINSETEQVKLFDTEEKAQKEFAKRIKQKLRQGWTECRLYPEMEVPSFPPVMLDYEPIGEEVMALFTPRTVCDASESVLRQWQRLGKQLYEGLSLQGAEPELRGDLLPMEEALQEIASWDCPDMQKEVKRTEGGLVLEVAYYIKGMRVLTLERGQLHAELALPRWRTFWYWHRPAETTAEGLVDDARTILSRFTQLCAEHLPAIIAKEEKRVRDEKVKSVAEVNIALAVKGLMEETDYSYQLLEEAKTTKLRVELSEYVELSLPHKTFLKRIGEVLPTLERVEELLEAMPLSLGMDSSIAAFRDDVPTWGQVKRTFIPDEPGWVDTSIEFWEPLLPECFEPSSFFNGAVSEDAQATLSSLLEMEIPGLRMEGSWYEASGGLRAVEVWYGEEEILYIDDNSMELGFAGEYFSISQGFFPSLENWERLLLDLATFYESHLPDYELAKEEALKKHTRLLEERNALEESIRRIMEDSSYEWALSLLPIRGWIDEPGQLYIRLAKHRVMCLYFTYEDVAEQVAGILPSIDLVLGAERDCRLVYKIG